MLQLQITTPNPPIRHWMTRLARPALMVVGALALGACATIPQPLTGNYATANPGQGAQGSQVRWGGQIIKTEPEADKTCFFVLSRPLDRSARPEPDGASQGRFVACHQGFYDPAVYTKGRDVTFTGSVHGSVTDKVGKYDYAYPRVQAQTVYLWPKRKPVVRYRDPFYTNPFWGPFGPWYYNRFWYTPRVIHVHRPPPPKPAPPSSGN